MLPCEGKTLPSRSDFSALHHDFHIAMSMRSTKDIKVLLWVGFALAYPLAVIPPVVIDPLLTSHVMYPSRQYPYAFLSILIYLLALAAQFLILRKGTTTKSLYLSVCVFFAAIVVTFPIFVPEFPHGNIFAVGLMSTFLCSFSIFVWSIGRQIALYTESLGPTRRVTVEYMTALSSFVRQGAFAAVALFGALFYGAFTTIFSFVDGIVTSKADIFLLKYNSAFQIGFYAIFSIVGPVRYFFLMNLHILSEFKKIVSARESTKAPKSRQRRS